VLCVSAVYQRSCCCFEHHSDLWLSFAALIVFAIAIFVSVVGCTFCFVSQRCNTSKRTAKASVMNDYFLKFKSREATTTAHNLRKRIKPQDIAHSAQHQSNNTIIVHHFTTITTFLFLVYSYDTTLHNINLMLKNQFLHIPNRFHFSLSMPQKGSSHILLVCPATQFSYQNQLYTH